MRIAVVLQMPSVGGLTRFTKALVDGVAAARDDVEVGLYVSHELVETESLSEHYQQANVRVIPVRDERVADTPLEGSSAGGDKPKTEEEKSLLWKTGRDVLKRFPGLHKSARSAYVRTRGRVLGTVPWYRFQMPAAVVDELRTYDVVYLATPWYMEAFDPGVPVVGTFHDLNFLRFPANFPEDMMGVVVRTMSAWARSVTLAVTSTHFIENELLEFAPSVQGKSRVVYLAPYSVRGVTAEQKRDTLDAFNLTERRYLMYPGSAAPHKNILGLVRAADLLKRRLGERAPVLVLTGGGVSGLNNPEAEGCISEVREFIERDSVLVLGEDVRALGWVSDVQVDALTASAQFVVSVSLYEAGCGPALDAWQYGTPVAMSDIPSFTEQIEALGVEALLFDPSDPESIASVLEKGLLEYEAALEMAERSQAAICKTTWNEVGQHYLEVFEEAIRIGVNR